jgi:hypothetical protein
VTDIYQIMDEAYSVIGGALCHADDLRGDKRAEATEKAKELLRLAEELAAFIEASK